MKKLEAAASVSSPVPGLDEVAVNSSAVRPAAMRFMRNASVKMNILPSGMAIIASTVSGRQGLTTMMAVSIYLQRYVNGEWENISGAYWSETFSHCCCGGFEVAYQAARGHLYRGYALIKAYCGSDCETRSLASNVMVY